MANKENEHFLLVSDEAMEKLSSNYVPRNIEKMMKVYDRPVILYNYRYCARLSVVASTHTKCAIVSRYSLYCMHMDRPMH